MTREQFEAALDAGTLEIRLRGNCTGKILWWACRRNGRTRTWKREPGRFEVPIKYGFRYTIRATQGNYDQLFRIAPEKGPRGETTSQERSAP